MMNIDIDKANRLVAFARSVEGASHTKHGKPCQDASLCLQEKEYTFIAVADGHGGDAYFRSDSGSKFAVRAASECMTDPAVIAAMKDSRDSTDKERNQIILQLKKSILARWNALVAADLEANPFTDTDYAGIPEKYAERYKAGKQVEHAYGSTIIAALRTDSFLLALQIGDGSCVMVDDTGVFSLPVPVDEKCFLNTTTSICDEDAIDEKRFRYYYTDKIPAAMILASDGIDDSFGYTDPEASPERLFDFYRVILTSFTEKEENAAVSELTDYLPRLSEKGSGDDISIGIMLDIPLLRTLGKGTDSPEEEQESEDSH
ncbi:MAG: protein phosphatase 2C domain-containing protein [Oscillospiraceae bacterium]|jgi:serine/threonine protein phosphatase PrpC|nr:protein phosphatase 2C domain-containing protein [Oscillospiraceae bacterium]